MQNAAPKCCKCRTHDSKKLAAPVTILKMQHLKILHIEYAANLRVHLASKFAAHFSQIAFCVLEVSNAVRISNLHISM